MTTIRLKIIKGPYKNTSYKLISKKITIGRSHDNDIVLENDDKCSRKQALIQLESNNNYSIKNLSTKSAIQVNDIVRIKTNLQDGDIIKFGSSLVQCEIIKSKNLNTVPAVAPHSNQPVPIAPTPLESTPHREETPTLKQPDIPPTPPHYNEPYPPANSKPFKKKQSILPKIILIGVACLGIYFYLEEPKNTKQIKDKLRTTQDIENNIQTLGELKQKEQTKRNKISLPSYQNAQAAFITGRRDYRKGVYSRAIEAFRVCKTLYPKHKLCYSYLQKAKIKNQQLIQAWMRSGKEYREKRRYIPCISSFKNVMVALQDKQNLIYKEALENYKICQIKHEDRY